MTKTFQSSFQPQIQFLRAIAVSLVVLSHSGFQLWSGGFVGVDMFFVVSGYVIGLSLINERVETNSNSISKFVQRRFFRIVPPLAVLISCLSAYAFFILPLDRAQEIFVAQSRAALFSFGNLFFIFSKDNYFDTHTNLDFFLHTWSLGVEEQFYIIIALLILTISKPFKHRQASNLFHRWEIIFRSLILFSFFMALLFEFKVFPFWSAEFEQSFGFYSPLTRGWELLIGVLIALKFNPNSREQFNSKRKSVVCFVLITTLFATLYCYQQGLLSVFVAILLTVLSTGTFIHFGPRMHLESHSIINSQLFQVIGNYSYSIYLWHWVAVPIVQDVFHTANPYITSLFMVLSLIPAFFSYRFVEISFRKVHTLSTKLKSIIGLSLVAIPMMCIVTVRETALSTRRHIGNVYPETVLSGCDYVEELCVENSSSPIKRILIIGDSHAYQLIPIVKTYAIEHNFQLTTCVMTCKDKTFSKIVPSKILDGDFDLIITSQLTNSETYSRVIQKDFNSKIRKLLLLGHTLHLVVLDNPYNKFYVAPRRVKYYDPAPLLRYEQEKLRSISLMNLHSDFTSATSYFDPFDALCNYSFCPTQKKGKALYLDNNHLSLAGIRLMEPSLVRNLRLLLEKSSAATK